MMIPIGQSDSIFLVLQIGFDFRGLIYIGLRLEFDWKYKTQA